MQYFKILPKVLLAYYFLGAFYQHCNSMKCSVLGKQVLQMVLTGLICDSCISYMFSTLGAWVVSSSVANLLMLFYAHWLLLKSYHLSLVVQYECFLGQSVGIFGVMVASVNDDVVQLIRNYFYWFIVLFDVRMQDLVHRIFLLNNLLKVVLNFLSCEHVKALIRCLYNLLLWGRAVKKFPNLGLHGVGFMYTMLCTCKGCINNPDVVDGFKGKGQAFDPQHITYSRFQPGHIAFKMG